jgi:serine phosphatase RsbU (regulator of sigma subunit)
VTEKAQKVSRRLPNKGDAPTKKKVSGKAQKIAKGRSAKTGRLKRGPKAAKAAKAAKVGRVTQRRKVAKPEQELEPITPFRRGISITYKFAIFTVAVVATFMALQGYLSYSIAKDEMEAQIMEQGLSMATTLEKTVDRRLWLETYDPTLEDQPTPMPGARSELIADWEDRFKKLTESSDGAIAQISLIEIPEGGGALNPIAVYPPHDISLHQTPLPQNDPDIQIYEGRLGAGTRVRVFQRKLDLALGKEHAIDTSIEKMQRLAEQEGTDAEIAKLLQEVRELTGAAQADMRDPTDALMWREQHPRPQAVAEWSMGGTNPPWVSIIVKASRLDDLRDALWRRLGLITALGALAASILTIVITTVLTAPIREMEQDLMEVARGDLSRQTRVQSRDELGALAHVLNIMIRNLRIAQTNAVERQAFERELNIAKEIQEKLLPERIPQIPGFDIHSHYNSAKEVGGDYYDFIVIDQTHLGIIVADVAGKGIPGAMVMTMARSLVRLASVRNISPADTFKKVNRILAKDIRRGMFVTAAYMVLNVKTRQLKVASAGHNPVVLYRAATGENELLKPAGIALGFDKGTIFDNHIKEVEVQLQPGDRIVTYTDGVNEAMNTASEEFGDDRFYDLVKKHAKKSSKDFVDAIVGALDEHRGRAEQSDDITITTLAVLGGAQG